jgi:hypothetical protein
LNVGKCSAPIDRHPFHLCDEKVRSASLARTPIDENAPEAETNYRSEQCGSEHVAWGGAARAADQEDGVYAIAKVQKANRTYILVSSWEIVS